MKWKSFFPFLSLTTLMFAPMMSWAGGVVQEFKVTSGGNVGQSSHAMTAQSQTVETVESTVHRTHPGPKRPHCPFKVEYDQKTNMTVLTWDPLYHNGVKAVRYHIYRWKVSDPTAQLLAVVDGQVFRYIDTEYLPDETYFYKIVGIYHIDGLYVSRSYPTQELKPLNAGGTGISTNVEGFPSSVHSPAPPSVGMGCQISSGPSSLPLSGLLLLLLLFVLPALRRTSHLS